MDWQGFVGQLEQKVDWYSPTFMIDEAPIVESLLRAAFTDYSIVAERLDSILGDTNVYGSLEPYIEYPRTLMDKFTIYVAPGDLFRVRLHRFWPRCIAGNAIEKVHYHKWHMSTIILSGEYIERRFTIEDCDEMSKVATLAEYEKVGRVAGQATSLPAKNPHQVHNPSESTPCLTLFVRGPSIQAHARIFNEATGNYYDTFSPTPQRRHALSRLKALDGNFHPMPESANQIDEVAS
ncbi:hypothetical protein [Nocardia sp. NPDC051750]|uniref:hypothetical protein n=1 Tax=Nocardia sp. NPDC051750 TaxID=3364325 RepID=UPI003790C68B